MMTFDNKPNPDDRTDNVGKLKSMIKNTEENIEKAENSLEFASETEQSQIKAKNERRKQSIESFQSEIKDESQSHE
ncbi:small acid-soluble spore protein Tlp [Cytobacillus horneckiae]|nr:small acid-soluble spore protein Tlp [Cytobacillus horneckiae]MCM3178354.1 small acid-soluble spore protein Tlp [Cytobacillus horneckiae]MEC1156906.1 small acid-soluble spore protein Tlp [Cytobacillus horneckiae]MED2940068.1 small acid-soluble spore protein Tlp [Cytobacillus horneckiae]